MEFIGGLAVPLLFRAFGVSGLRFRDPDWVLQVFLQTLKFRTAVCFGPGAAICVIGIQQGHGGVRTMDLWVSGTLAHTKSQTSHKSHKTLEQLQTLTRTPGSHRQHPTDYIQPLEVYGLGRAARR